MPSSSVLLNLMEVRCLAACMGAGPQRSRAGSLTSSYLLLIKKGMMQGGCGSSTSSSLSSLPTGLALSTVCAARATQPGKIGTLCATIRVVCLRMLSLVMQGGCIVVLMQEMIAILLGIAVELFVQYACKGVQKYYKELAKNWPKKVDLMLNRPNSWLLALRSFVMAVCTCCKH